MSIFPLKKVSILVSLTLSFFFNFNIIMAQSTRFTVEEFDKVIVSPHIEVVFKKGDIESVQVEWNIEPIVKFNVEVKNKTLQLYLDGAKMATKSEEKANNRKVPLYTGTVIKAIVTYKDVESFSLRGEERFVFESPIETDELTLNIFGESQVLMNDLKLKELKVTIYGESFLKVDKGVIGHQKITAYGESSVSMMDVASKSTKITAYGDGSFQFNVSEELKITSYGEPTVTYKGDAQVKNGLSFGEASVVKMN